MGRGGRAILAVGAAVVLGGIAWLGLSRGTVAPAGTPATGPVPPVAPPPSPTANAPTAADPAAGPALAADGQVLGRLVRGTPPRPLSGAVELALPGGGTGRVAAGEDGRFEAAGLPRGIPLALAARSGDFPAARLAGLRIPAAGSLDLGDIALGPGEAVEVRVRDERNAPAKGAVVTLHRRAEDPGRAPDGWDRRDTDFEVPPLPDPEFRETIGAGGSVRFSSVPPGDWLAVSSLNGTIEGRAPVRVAEGFLREPVVILLGRGESLAGRVLRADGSPAAGLRIRAHSFRWGSSQGPPTATVVDGATGEAGEFRLEGLPRWRQAIWVEAAPGAWCQSGMVQIPVTGAVELQLPALATLAGRVLADSTGEAIPGAEVIAERDSSYFEGGASPPFRVRQRSDASGAYRLQGIAPGGACTLRVGRPGFMPWEGWVELEEAAAPPEKEVRLVRGSAVRGRVLRSDGTAVANALVWARPLKTTTGHFRREELGEETRRVRSGPDGAYRIEGVAPGTVLLAATAEGFLLPDMPLGLAWGYHPDSLPDSLKVEVPPGGETVRDLAMVSGATLKGIVVDEAGKPAAGFSVRTGSWPRQDRHQNQAMVPDGEGVAGPTAADGTFRIAGLMAGSRRFVRAAGPGFLEGWSRTFDLGEGESIRDLRITVKRVAATVAGTVRNEDGTPAAGALVGLADWDIDGTREGMEYEADCPVDATGAFRAEGVRPGEYTVYTAAPGSLCGVGPRLTLIPGEIREGIALVLPRGGVIAGRVQDPEGKAIPGAAVLVEPVREDQEEPEAQYAWGGSPGGNGPRVPVTSRANATADAGGRFRREGLAPRDVWVTAGAPGHLEAWTRARPGDEAIAIRLERSLAITGRAVDAETGAPASGVPIWAQAGDDVRVEREPDWEKTGEDGTFRIAGLGPGTYRIKFASHSNEPAQEFLELAVEEVAAGTEGLEVRLRRGGVLAGQVLDQDGAPVGDVSLRLHEEKDGEKSFGFGIAHLATGADGRFRFAGLEPGPFVIEVAGEDDFGGSAGNRNVVPAEFAGQRADGREVVLRVRRGLPIRGRVLAPGGKPALPDPHRGNGRVVYVPSGRALHGGEDETCFADDDTATFETPPLAPGGTWDLHASGFADTLGGVLRGVPPGARVEIRLEAGLTISGRVVDEAGNPVPKGIRVELDPAGDGNWGYADTGADGTFRVAGLAEGKYGIKAGGDGSDYLEGVAKEPVPAGATGVVIVAPKGASISGRILDAKGKPVRFPRVSAKDGSGGSDSSEDGTFVVRGLKPGKTRLVWHEPERYGRSFELGDFDAPSSGHVLTLPTEPPPAKPEENDGKEGD